MKKWGQLSAHTPSLPHCICLEFHTDDPNGIELLRTHAHQLVNRSIVLDGWTTPAWTRDALQYYKKCCKRHKPRRFSAVWGNAYAVAASSDNDLLHSNWPCITTMHFNTLACPFFNSQHWPSTKQHQAGKKYFRQSLYTTTAVQPTHVPQLFNL